MKKQNRIILISSSTGGHALPIFYIHEELKKEFDLRILHSGSQIERTIFKDCKSIKILAGKVKRYNYISTAFQLLKSSIGFLESFLVLLFFRPKLIISKGGFCAVPVLSAAKLLRIPYVAHESDSFMGVSNRVFAKSAKKMFVGFPLSFYSDTNLSNLMYSGQIVSVNDRLKRSSKQIIYITGGSQGAKSINDIIFEIAPKLLDRFRIIHQVGDLDVKQAEQFKDGLSEERRADYDYFNFSIEKSRKSLAEADLVISRAGATTIGEIAALSLASILIPYKYASGDHQLINAKFLEKSGGAIMIKEDNLNPKALLERVEYILKDKLNAKSIGEKAHKVLKSDGLQSICSYVRKDLQ